MDYSPPGSSVHGILQAKILQWVAILFSEGIFLTLGLNLHLLRWQADSLSSELPGKPISLRLLQFAVIHTASVGCKIGMGWPDHTL